LKSPDASGIYTCPESGLRYRENDRGVLRCLELHEDTALPDEMRIGKAYYDDVVHGRREQ
jgi:UDP-2-acetamido-3-amino-2,3-dideoxy-glucuronate N-acetyltransferase